MKTAMKTTLIVAACCVAAPVLAAGTPRSDTEVSANTTQTIPNAGPGEKYSNWPALPERQAGKSYSKRVKTTFGLRERNFESGR